MLPLIKKLTLFFILTLFYSSSFSLSVNSYYGVYSTLNKAPYMAAPSLDGPMLETWEFISKPKSKYRFAALLPDTEDNYWLNIGYGLVSKANELGIDLDLFVAKGRNEGRRQIKQLEKLIRDKSLDGIIISPLYYHKLDKHIDNAISNGIKVLSLAKEAYAPAITGKIVIPYYNLGYEIGRYVIKDAKGKDIKIAFFPGPKESIWASDVFRGFTESLKNNPDKLKKGTITIVAEQYGNLSYKRQSKLIDFVFKAKSGINYLIGNNIAAKAGVDVLNKHNNRHKNVKIISTNIDQEVYKLISNGKIYASASDSSLDLGRLSIDYLVKALEKETIGGFNNKLPFRVEPKIGIISSKDYFKYNYYKLFAPDDFYIG